MAARPSRLRPVWRPVWAKAATMAGRAGCDVMPARGAAAPSTASTPALAAAR